MNLNQKLLSRSHSKCELCENTDDLKVYHIPEAKIQDDESSLITCGVCRDQIESMDLETTHWRSLTQSMWSEFKPVQVMAYRLLTVMKDQEAWALDLLEQLFLDDADRELALAGVPSREEADSDVPTLDSNGTRLYEGDSVTLIKDLEVKGGGFTAKRGTLVKNISLAQNPKHIEGRVNGIQIVLISAYLKKV